MARLGISVPLRLTEPAVADLEERSTVPKQLLVLGIRQYRQLIVKQHRIIYQQQPAQVVDHAILNGRRDEQTLLTQRLIGEL